MQHRLSSSWLSGQSKLASGSPRHFATAADDPASSATGVAPKRLITASRNALAETASPVNLGQYHHFALLQGTKDGVVVKCANSDCAIGLFILEYLHLRAMPRLLDKQKEDSS